MKLQEHKREVDRQVQHRRELMEAQRKAELEHDRLDEDEAAKRQVIDEEKRRLLEEYGDELKHHLPKHLLEAAPALAFKPPSRMQQPQQQPPPPPLEEPPQSAELTPNYSRQIAVP